MAIKTESHDLYEYCVVKEQCRFLFNINKCCMTSYVSMIHNNVDLTCNVIMAYCNAGMML